MCECSDWYGVDVIQCTCSRNTDFFVKRYQRDKYEQWKWVSEQFLNGIWEQPLLRQLMVKSVSGCHRLRNWPMTSATLSVCAGKGMPIWPSCALKKHGSLLFELTSTNVREGPCNQTGKSLNEGDGWNSWNQWHRNHKQGNTHQLYRLATKRIATD